MKIYEINTCDWDNLIKQSSFQSIFIHSSWIKIVTQYIGGKCTLVCLDTEDGNYFLFPSFYGGPWCDESSFKIGTIGYGGPVILGSHVFNPDHLYFLERYLRKKCVSITGLPGQNFDNFKKYCASFKNNEIFLFDLPESIDSLFERFSGNVRTTIRKATKNNINVSPITKENIDIAYELLINTQNRVARYNTNYSFFKHLIMDSNCSLGYIAMSDIPLSMGVFLISEYECMHYLNGYVQERANLCANQLIIYKAMIESLCQKRKIFNFGESSYDSLHQAKKRWGGKKTTVTRIVI